LVAFVVSFVGTIALCAAILAYGRRRPVGTPVSWGEAMVAATLVIFIALLAFGIVPHQWLQFADSELGWRHDRIFSGPEGTVGDILPFTITFRVLRDFILLGIYGVGVVGMVVMWMLWQNRGQKKPKELPTSPYGRPLVRKA
jgi:hypothetical protein